MRERREIARGADRALRGNHRIDLVCEQREQSVDETLADAGKAARQRIDFQREDQPHDRIRQRLADPRSMRQQQVSLEQFQLFGRNARLREQPEARVDTVGGIARRDDPIDETARRDDACAIGGAELQGDRPLVDTPQRGEREFTGADRHGLGPRVLGRRHYGRSIMGRFRPCSRAQSIAIWYPASAWRMTPVPGSFQSTRAMRLLAAAVPSQTITTPECCE